VLLTAGIVAGILAFASELPSGLYKASCETRLQAVTLAVLGHANDHDGRLPNRDTWQADIEMYLGPDEEGSGPLLRCPETGKAYVLNGALAGKRVADITNIVNPRAVPIIWEEPAIGGKAPHAVTCPFLGFLMGCTEVKYYNVAFLDGHMERLDEAEFGEMCGTWRH
jgi:hypothetical protein